jgi:hypothetical protein
MRKPWLLAVLLALDLTPWNATAAAPGENPDGAATDGVIDNARESDPVHTHQHGGTSRQRPLDVQIHKTADGSG